MIFNEHSDLAGKHAFLGPSKYHWINYDPEKLERAYLNSRAAARGVELHAFAHHAIRLGIMLPDNGDPFNLYVNDGIGYHMRTEQILFYSPNCYGTTDTICFRQELLRIHDLKTGFSAGSIHQLEIYAALFCLEYGVRPGEIDMELRIYHPEEILVCTPELDDIAHIMSTIVSFDRRIEMMKRGEAGR